MISYTSLIRYRTDLIKELGSLDKDTIQDAVWNSEDHLRLLMKDKMKENMCSDQGSALEMAVAEFGYPRDIAEAYKRNM